MSSEIAKTIVDQIASMVNLMQRRNRFYGDGKEKAAETVDMKRVEMQVDWMNTPQEPRG